MPENEKLLPKRRFKEFQDAEGWEQRRLGSFGESTGGTSLESEFCNDGKYKVISIGSYSEQSTYTEQGIRVKISNKTRNRILKKNDLTMILNDKTASGNIIGRVLLIDNDNSYVFNQRTERIEPYHDKYNSQFLYQLLNAPKIRDMIFKQSQGNTQIYVNWSVIKETTYIIPEIIEQEKIGDFFCTFDDIINLQKCKLKKTKALKSAYLSEMFPAEEECVPKRRFAGFIDEWERQKLGDVGEIITGSTPPTNDPENYSDDGMIWVTPTDINDITITNTTKRLSLKGQTKARKIPANSILITCIASIGKNSMNLIPASFNQQINALVPNEYNDSYFLLTQSKNWSAKMKSIAASQIMPIVNKTEFSKISTITPALEEQTAIGNFFRTLDDLITLRQRKLDKLQNIKKAYLNETLIKQQSLR